MFLLKNDAGEPARQYITTAVLASREPLAKDSKWYAGAGEFCRHRSANLLRLLLPELGEHVVSRFRNSRIVDVGQRATIGGRNFRNSPQEGFAMLL